MKYSIGYDCLMDIDTNPHKQKKIKKKTKKSKVLKKT
jgi:hypothetical protein